MEGHHMHRTAGVPEEGHRVPLVGHLTVPGLIIGTVLGGLIGATLGAALGQGQLAIPGLAPFLADGVLAPSVVVCVLFGSVLGLVGAVTGSEIELRFETLRPEHAAHDPSHHAQHEGWIQQLPLIGSAILVAFMLYTLYDIASTAIGRGEVSDQSNRVTWVQKNVTRLGDGDDANTAIYVLRTAYPSTRPENSPRTVLVVPDDWRIALVATSLVSRPPNAAVLVEGDPAFERLSLPAPERLAGDPVQVAAGIDERLSAGGGGVAPSNSVIVVASDADFRWAIPAGAYAARTGTPILFVTRQGIPEATASALRRRGGHARIFLLAPVDAVPQAIVTRLERFGHVTRITGGDTVESAIRFAEFRDAEAEFGWGLTGWGIQRQAPFNAILANASRWQDGVLGAHLARAGKSGPILLTEADRIPPLLDAYLWRHRPAFAATPAEGPFNHLWAVGSFERIPYPVQAWADYALEIEQYMTLGDSALSGFEALGVCWLILSFACAAWIVYHAIRRRPDIMPMMRAAWALFALLLGPLALLLYVRNYGWPSMVAEDGMTMWQRPLFDQAVSATVMMFGFDMMLMVLAVFLIAYVTGFPTVPFDGAFFWLGSAMFLMMVLMYVVAFVVMMLVFHAPMTMHHERINSYWKAFMVGLPMMAATMTVESLGMMPTMWWAQMLYLPAMQMPTSDDMTMWATLLIAVLVGFLVVLPFNYALVKRGLKQGTM
jgi:hypothetical protein